MTTIADNLTAVRARMAQACAAVGRNAHDVTLVAVSKKKPVEAIVTAYEAGQRDFGENYAQELAEKAQALCHLPDLRWHFIGALQRNKAKLVVPSAVLIHSVDSAALLDKIEALAAVQQRSCEVLVQINVTGEASKSGISDGELPPLLDRFADTPHLRCLGLMTMPELDQDPTAAFTALRRLREEQQKRALPANVSLTQLSMGMTADLEIAIAHGATLIRVGTAIFGER